MPVIEDPNRAEIEAQARQQGWVPKEEFRGNQESWRDADEYVRRGDPRYLREVLDKTEHSLREMDKRQRDLEQQRTEERRQFQEQFARLDRMSGIALQRQRDQLLAQIEHQKLAAVELGDTAAYNQWRQAENEVWQQEGQIREAITPQRQPQQPQQQQQEAPEVVAFKQRNRWFTEDPALNMEAQAIHVGINQQSPYMPLEDNLKQVEAEIKRRYPQKFGITPPQQQQTQSRYNGPSVEGGGRMANVGAGAYAGRLDQKERAQAERDVKYGLYKNVEEWAKFYFNS